MSGDTHQRSNQPLQITVSFDYLVNVVGDQIDLEGLRDNLVFRLGHDDAEIPFGEKVLAALKAKFLRSYREALMSIGSEVSYF